MFLDGFDTWRTACWARVSRGSLVVTTEIGRKCAGTPSVPFRRPASLPRMERRLRESERDELLKEPLTAVLATERKSGGVHAAPVWYLYRGAEFRVITGRSAVKLKNALRTGRATLCVQRSRGNVRRYVTAEGAVRVEPCSIEERRELWAHYTDESKADAMAAGDLSGLCVLILVPQRWTARSE